MSAKYATLGLMRDGAPAYSYELAARVRELLGPSFDIGSGQMTQILRALHKEKLVEGIDESPPDTKGRPKVVYAITEAGRADYEKFFVSGPNVTQLARRSLLVKIALAGAERLGEILAQLDAYEQDCVDRIDELKCKLDELLPDDQLRPQADRVFLRLGIEADKYQLGAELAWARHAREIVSWLRHSDPIWPPAIRRPGTPSDASQARRDEARQDLFDRLAKRDRN